MKNNGSLLPLISKILFIVFLTASSIFSQTTYYISSSEGNDSNNGTTESTPWKSLDKLHSSWNQIGPGDKILFKRGDEWVPTSMSPRKGLIYIQNKNGTAANPIIIDAYGFGDLPIISKENTSDYGSALRFWGSCSYVFVRNISINGSITFDMDRAEFGVTDGMHHIKITDFDLTNGAIGVSNYMSGISHVPNSNDPYTNPLYKIEIGNGSMTDLAGEDAMNFIFGVRYIDEDGNPTTYANRATIDWATESMPDTNFWIHDMTILNIGLNGEAIDLPGGNLHLIERNIMSGSRSSGNVFKVHSEYSRVTDCIFRDNEITGAWWDYYLPPLPNSSSLGAVFKTISDCIIENNTFSARYPLLIGDHDGTGTDTHYGTFTGNIIRNNNVYGTTYITGEPGLSSWGYTHDMLDSITYLNTFEGNNWWHSPNSQWLEDGGRKLFKLPQDESKNIATDASGSPGGYRGTFTQVWVNEFGVTGDTHVDPQMVDPIFTSPYDRGDYSLKSNSPLIDAGSITGNEHIYDINKNQRVQGNVDIGAFEFNGIDVTPPKINSINVIDFSNLVILFSENIQKESAEDTKNYSITPTSDISLISAELQSDSKSVNLVTSQQPPGSYLLEANNLFDLAGNIIDPEANTISYSFSSAIDTTAIVQYDFIQGETPGLINDISGGENQVDLIIESVSDVEWLQPNGISINSPTKILSKHPAKKITDACIQTGEISIAVWLKPHTLNQNGPARIASLSENANVRNFTLGHGGADGEDDVFDFRLRTTESNSNGLPSVTTQPGCMTTSLPNHLVYTRDKDGVAKIFINSIEIESENIGGNFSNWDNTFHFIIGNEFTGDRPWLGEIYSLSIYDVALSNYKIDSLYSVNVITNTNYDTQNLPKNFILEQNYPNPFNPYTKIKFKIPANSIGRESNSSIPVKLIVYGILGNKITTLVDEDKSPGIYEVEFDGKDLSSGIYFYKIDAGDFQATKKMLFIK